MKILIPLFIILLTISCDVSNDTVYYTFVKEGEIKHTEYLQGGAFESRKTIVTFKDDTTFIFYTHYNIHHKYIYIYHRKSRRMNFLGIEPHVILYEKRKVIIQDLRKSK